MLEPSQTMANWEVVARTVLSAFDKHGEAIAMRLEAELFPAGAPSPLTVAMILTAMRGLLERRLDEARMKETALAEERADDAPVRKQRDHYDGACRERLMSVRSLVEGAYGREAAERTGLAGRVPDAPDLVVQKAETAASLLETTDLGPPRTGAPLDLVQLAGDLRLAASRSRDGLRAVQQEKREEHEALHQRDRAMRALSRAYSGVADLLVALATLAERDDVAERVRPTARRRAGFPEQQDATADDPGPAGQS